MTGNETPGRSDRRQATVLFADISGFTALSQKMDPEDMADTMDACFRVLEKVIVDRGGVIDKFIGDCVMALFGAPKSIEHAPRQAVNAAIAIRIALRRFNVERNLPSLLDCHIGVNTGLVVAGDMGGDVRRDYTVMGPTVNLAARLEGAAHNGQVFIGPSTYRYVSGEFAFKRLAPLELKGIEARVQAWELDTEQEYVRDPRAADRALALHSETVGRDPEIATIRGALVDLAAIRGALAELVAGRGGVVAIEGANGIGKSRLLAEGLRGSETSSVLALEGRSVSIGQSPSFHSIVDLIEAWAGVPEGADEEQSFAILEAAVTEALGEGADDVLPFAARICGLTLPARYRERLDGIQGEALETMVHRSVRKLVTALARARPLALIFDDLQWADPSSILLLASILPVVETEPVLFLFAFRPEYDATIDAVLTAIRERNTAKRVEMALGPLAESGSRALLRNLLGSAEFPQQLADLIQSKARGNPLYIEEVLRSLLDAGALERRGTRLVATGMLESVEIHGTIEEVIMGRVDRLPAATRAVLETAAVVGRFFHKRVLAQVVMDPEGLDDELERLVERHFLSPVSSRQGADSENPSSGLDDGYAFENPFTQEKLYDTVLKRTRREIHARCTVAIEKIYADRPSELYAVLAWHATQAESWDKAREYLQKAGEAAASSAASTEALAFFREAYRVFLLSRGESGNAEERAGFERNIAMALLNSGRLAESIEHFNAALELLGEHVPKTDMQARMRFARDLPAVLARLYTGRLGRRNEGSAKDRLLFELMYNRCRAQNIVDAERSFFDNIAAIRHVGHLDPETVENAAGIFASSGAFFSFAGISFDVSRRFLAISAGLAERGTPTDRFQHETMRFAVDWHQGEWSADRDIARSLLEHGLRVGLLWNADVYLGLRCERDIRQGRFEAASTGILALVSLSEDWGYDFARSNEYAMRAFLLFEQRRLGEAREAVQRYHDFRSEDTLHVLALSARSGIETFLGDLDAAEETLAAAELILARAGRLPLFYLGALRTARLRTFVARLEAERAGGGVRRATLRGARRAARQACAVSKRIAREQPECARLSARLEWLGGRTRAARAMWKKALAVSQKLGALPELARTHADIAEALLAQGHGAQWNGEDGAAWLARAEVKLRELGCDWDLDRLEAIRRI